MNHFIYKQEEAAGEDRASQRLKICRRILTDDFMSKLPYCRDMLELVDKNKVSFQVNQSELTGILENGGFSLAEQAYIRRMRHQGRNNMAAKRLRNKKREKECSEEINLDKLRAERYQLVKEKEILLQEIESYRRLLRDC